MRYVYRLLLLFLCLWQTNLQAQISLKPNASTFDSKVTINAPLENNGLKYPTSDGSNGQVLTTNGAGDLSWANVSGEGTDFSTFYDYICNSSDVFEIDTSSGSGVDCGTLYDSGGANGNYGDNELEFFTINILKKLELRLTLESLNLADAQDTLFIENIPYTSTSTTPITLFFRDNVRIQFKSNGTGNASGFEISWESLVYNGASSLNSSGIGFFYDAEKQSIGGGIERDSAWSKIGCSSTLFGAYSSAAGDRSLSIGYENRATQDLNMAIGAANEVTGQNGIAIGIFNRATASSSIAIGSSNEANGITSVALGFVNRTAGDNNAALGFDNSTSGDDSSAFGYRNSADGNNSSAFGGSNRASGMNSSAFGYLNEAENEGSAFGIRNRALGSRSIAFGRVNTASNGGIAFGFANSASAERSTAFGYSLLSDVYQMTAIGCYNEDPIGSSDIWVDTDPVFIIGNGEGGLSRSTALTILKNGNVGIGTTTPSELLDINGKIKLGSAEMLEDGGSFILATNSNFLPTTDNERDLGSSSNRWDDVFATSGTVNTSDARNKTNINSLDYGLEQVMQLKPVRFEWKGQKEKGEKIGFLAQDLLEVLPEVVKTHDWVQSEEGGAKKKVAVENLGVYYSDIIPVLASAIQEQQQEIEEKEERITELEDRIGQLEKMMLELSKQQTESRSEQIDINSSKAQLLQNRPNPFQDYTEISYYLPENVRDAYLQISNGQGQILERIELEGAGEGGVLLETNQLANGYYQYALVVDEKVMMTKRMLIAR